MKWIVKEINKNGTLSKETVEEYARRMNDIVNPYYKKGLMGFMTMGCYKRSIEEENQKVAFLWPSGVSTTPSNSVGFAYAIYRKRPGSIKCIEPPFLQIKQIVVQEEYGRKKGGAALMKWAEQLYPEDIPIALQLMPDNKLACNFYKKNGFVHKESIKTGKNKDRTEDVMVLF